jgi:hypothetical protein
MKSRLISSLKRFFLKKTNKVDEILTIKDVNNKLIRIQIQNRIDSRARDQFVDFKSIFLPEQFPQSVGSNFSQYCCWLMLQNSVGSAAYVLSTHALLTSLGIGGGAVTTAAMLPLATTMNWVLKDGLGSLGMIAFAARGGAAARFDGDAKVTKWRADVLFNVGVALELLTPLAPALFLPLASLANVAKGVGGLAAGASKAALHRALALRDNLGDVTAKLYSQGIAAYLVGMAGGIALAHAVAVVGAPAGALAAFGALTAVHLAASHRALRCVELRSLNVQRLHLLALHYRATGRIAAPADVARDERIVALDWPPAIVVAPSLVAGDDDDAAATVAARLVERRRAVLIRRGRRRHSSSATLHFRHDYTRDDVCAAFYEAVAREDDANEDEAADRGDAFAAALGADSRWAPSVELIRIDHVLMKMDK